MELVPDFDSPPAPLAERLRFTFTAPKRLGPRLVIHPVPLWPLLITLVLAGLASLPLTLSDTGRKMYSQAFVEDWQRRQGQGLAPPATPAPVDSYLETLVPIQFARAMAVMLAMVCIVAYVVRIVLSDTEHTLYNFYLGLTAHAGIILGIGSFFNSAMMLLREDLNTTFWVGLVAPGVPADSSVGLLVGIFEPFNLWAFYVLGVAMAAAIGWSQRRVFLPLGGLYVGYRVLLAAFNWLVL